MKRYITTIKKFSLSLLLAVFAFLGAGGPTAFASITPTPLYSLGACNWQAVDRDGNTGNNFAVNQGAGFTDASNTKVFSIMFGDFASRDVSAVQANNGNTTVTWTATSGYNPSHWYANLFHGAGVGDYWAVMQDPAGGNICTSWTWNGSAVVPLTPPSCDDNVQNGTETGVDIGGSCQNVVINTPIDTEETNEFTNFSVSYSGIDMPDTQHEVWVQWSDNNTLLTTCNDGVAGSTYTGSFVSGASYSTCTNSIPRIYIDKNTISFSAGIHSYTGSVPKSHSLVDGTTYYAQAFIVDTETMFYAVASDVISFTMSGGVPVITGTGTITNTAGSGSITGTGTHFTSTLHIGDTLTVDGQQCRVLSIASDTELECTPLTSAHTGDAYTQNSNFDSGSIAQENCSTWDFGCYIKNTISWFFGVSDTTLQNFGTLTLRDRMPFSYISDVGVLFGETFDQSADDFSLDIDLMGSSFTVLSTTQLEAISFQPLVRTVMGAIAMFFTVMFIYRKVIKVHDAGHHTA